MSILRKTHVAILLYRGPVGGTKYTRGPYFFAHRLIHDVFPDVYFLFREFNYKITVSKTKVNIKLTIGVNILVNFQSKNDNPEDVIIFYILYVI